MPENKPLRYLPFLKGIYSTAPGLSAMNKGESAPDKMVFQIDDTYRRYIVNKEDCRRENIRKYYCEENLSIGTTINKYLVEQLLKDHPDKFSFTDHQGYTLINKLTNEMLKWKTDWLAIEGTQYLTLFDALCCQVQEDLAICQLDGSTDWVAALHLCAPNHWAAQDKIGKPFDFVHAHVPGMEKTMPHYPAMLQSIVNKGPFTRFAWGIATDDHLNHHPLPPTNIDAKEWIGRNFDADTTELFLRVERQNLIGFPNANAFLFTIRTYFYNADSLQQTEKSLLMAAIDSMSPASLEYKGLTGKIALLRERLIGA